MNRSAKGLRIISGILMLLNLIAFFLPITKRVQENYATLYISQMDYVENMFSKVLPHGEENAVYQITSGQIVWILLLIILPLILVLLAGIWSIVGDYRQIGSSIVSVLVLGIYIGMVVSLEIIWPETANGSIYTRGISCGMHLIFSGSSVCTSIIAFLLSRTDTEKVSAHIPNVTESKQQVQAKYNIIAEGDSGKKESFGAMAPPQKPRGVMVGLTGMYATAEIPFSNGEYLKLGRLVDNDLIFEGQPKVSRNHCRIKWDVQKQKYIFCDYSSNGSFVNGSKDCLPQNLEMELEPGTVIAIGDETNTFRLE